MALFKEGRINIMPKKGYKWSREEKEKRRQGMIKAYKNNSTLREKTKHFGETNGRYIDGHTYKKKLCKNCNILIKVTRKTGYCIKCRPKFINGFKNRKHSEITKKNIGLKSKAKFTKGYLFKQRKKFEKLGLWIPLKNIKPYILYCKEANWKEKMFNFMSPKELKLLKVKGLFSHKNTKGLVRDHEYSRYSGFKNKIPAILLRHPVNCQLISHADNISKAKKYHRYKDGDSISLTQLFRWVKNFKPKWNEQKECLKAMKNYRSKNVVVGGEL